MIEDKPKEKIEYEWPPNIWQCRACRCFKGHSYNCILAPEEELRQQIKNLLWQLERRENTHSFYRAQLTALHSKIALFRHENNKLRRKLFPSKGGG